MWYMKILHTNLVPDFLLRITLRLLTLRKVKALDHLPFSELERRRNLRKKLDCSPIAIHTDMPNVQHYDVAPAFFKLVLGKRLKYSCCYWPDGVTTLDEWEVVRAYFQPPLVFLWVPGGDTPYHPPRTYLSILFPLPRKEIRRSRPTG